MKEQRSGFTILEIVLVLAITTLLFISTAFGITQRVSYGRYNTGSSEIASFLEGAYSDVINTENSRSPGDPTRRYCTLAGSVHGEVVNGEIQMEGNSISGVDNDNYPGRTNCAVYGKILFFGATRQDTGEPVVYAFDVIGDVVDNANAGDITEVQQSSGVLAALQAVHADYLAPVYNNLSEGESGGCRIAPALSVSSYTPNWGITFKTANFGGSSGYERDDGFVGMILIVRAPASGEVTTFFYQSPAGDDAIVHTVSEVAGSTRLDVTCSNNNESSIRGYTLNYEAFENYEPAYVDGTEKNRGFCLSSGDFWVAIGNLKNYISFSPNGRNATTVELDQTEDNPCRG